MVKKTTRKATRASQTTADRESDGIRITASSRVGEPQAAPDYDYIKNDLKRIGVLSGSIFAFMVLLYFILPFISPLYAR